MQDMPAAEEGGTRIMLHDRVKAAHLSKAGLCNCLRESGSVALAFSDGQRICEGSRSASQQRQQSVNRNAGSCSLCAHSKRCPAPQPGPVLPEMLLSTQQQESLTGQCSCEAATAAGGLGGGLGQGLGGWPLTRAVAGQGLVDGICDGVGLRLGDTCRATIRLFESKV